MSVRYSVTQLRELPRGESFTVASDVSQDGSYMEAVVVSDGVLDALLAALDTARDLADLAAHVVCEPRRFHANEDNVQQLLGEAVARVRDTLAHFEFDHEVSS